MEFFNRKEEVIDIKLTQYGKKKYAQGKFSPKFYAFGDEEIVYDFSYSGTSEPEHSASVRIKDALRMKVPSSLLGIDSTVENMVNDQQDVEKYYSHTKRITNSDPNTNYVPSWSIKSYCGKISSHSQQKSVEGRQPVDIPQLTLENLKFKLIKVEDATEEQKFYGVEQEDGSCYTISAEDGEYLFSFGEENSLSIEEKFDIQVFEVTTNIDGKETLQELKFPKTPKKIVNGIYAENTADEEEKDETYASSRFTLETDYEISKNFMKSKVGDQISIMRQGEIRRLNDGDNFTTSPKVEQENLRTISLDDIASLTTQQLKERAAPKNQNDSGIYAGLPKTNEGVED